MSHKSLKFTQTTSLGTAKYLYQLLDASLVDGATISANVTHVYIQAEAQTLRWRSDGTAPTAAVGFNLTAGQILVLTRSEFTNFRIIEATAGGIANVQAYKNG